jgi:hypothetical protein
MALLDTPLAQITEADLTGLIAVQAPESLLIDYKRQTYGLKETDRTEFLKDISSFANTLGGDLVIGMDEADRLPTQVVPFTGSVDVELRRFQDWAKTGLEPRLAGLEMHAVPIAAGGHVLIVRARRSYIRPHGVVFGGRTQFCARYPLGRYEPNVAQLRALFNEGPELARQVRDFRMERLIRLQAGANPAGLGTGAKAALHVVSMEAFADGRLIDVVDLIARGTHVPLPPSGFARDNRPAVNLDGFLNVMYGAPAAYAQFFRSGCIEGVLELPSDGEGRFIGGIDFGNTIVAATKQYIDVLNVYGAGGPYVILLAISESKGVRLRYGMRHAGGGYYQSDPCAEDLIATPDILLEGPGDNVTARLRPAFNMIWNAYGVHPCELYNQAGDWIGVA